MPAAPNTPPSEAGPRPVGRPRRSQEDLLAAAAAVFVESGVDAPVREIAARAGVGVGTVYRHFPTRPALVVAVYRHQVEACAEAGPKLLAERGTAAAALRAWVAMFVDFLVTKHGLADALRGETAGSDELHAYFVDRLVPVCGSLLEAARAERGLLDHEPVLSGYSLLKGIGNLCIGASGDSDYDADRLVQALVSGALADTAPR
ncbi:MULTISPECIES: TetR/AcrR family transcriptional regulator [unclassified Agromyces]|uniref:TetR/AcrR family transcriptional regulator n=1 Tax=unclassified Agromyces TaxID=2639701 RepID=UPI0030149C78